MKNRTLSTVVSSAETLTYAEIESLVNTLGNSRLNGRINQEEET